MLAYENSFRLPIGLTKGQGNNIPVEQKCLFEDPLPQDCMYKSIINMKIGDTGNVTVNLAEYNKVLWQWSIDKRLKITVPKAPDGKPKKHVTLTLSYNFTPLKGQLHHEYVTKDPDVILDTDSDSYEVVDTYTNFRKRGNQIAASITIKITDNIIINGFDFSVSAQDGENFPAAYTDETCPGSTSTNGCTFNITEAFIFAAVDMKPSDDDAKPKLLMSLVD